MKTKQYKICLRNYRSWFPGIVPSYDENLEKITFDETTLEEYISGNYGMIPVNVEYNGRMLPYSEIRKRYLFFLSYYKEILKTNVNEGESEYYDTAMDYYEAEITVKNPETEEYYSNLDSTFLEYGGKDMFEWINKNIIMRVKIPTQFIDYWDCEYLYYPEIVEWRAWFEIRYPKYSGGTVDYNDPYCCDYKEYLNRGGNAFHDWIIQQHLQQDTLTTETPYLLLTLPITRNIDDLGIMSPNATEWEEGETISGMTYSPKDNVWSKKYHDYISIYNDYLWKKTSQADTDKGHTYEYSEVYREIKFKEDGWEKMNPISTDTYSYINGRMIPTQLDETYEVFSKECTIINGKLLIAEEKETVMYNNMNYIVLYNRFNVPYIKLNNKVKPLMFDTNESNYYLLDVDKKTKKYKTTNKGIFFNGIFNIIKDNKVSVVDYNILYVYPIFKQYTVINNSYCLIKNNRLQKLLKYKKIKTEKDFKYRSKYEAVYVNDNETFGKYKTKSNDGGYSIKTGLLSVLKPYSEPLGDEITGYTDSKLDALKPLKMCYDDLGNLLPGLFLKDENDLFIQPTENTVLDIYYHKGDTSGFEQMLDEEGNLMYDNGKLLYYGNIITDVVFYFNDGFGEPNMNTSASTIEEAITKKDTIKENDLNASFEDNISCKITYRIGAALAQNSDDKGNTYTLSEEYGFGIEYEDIIHLEKKQTTYYMNADISYPIFYYEMQYDLIDVTLGDYSDKKIESKRANFRYKRNTDEQMNNIMQRIPLTKEAEFVGISLQPRVTDNVLVDRGSAASFDKHLKLTEIGTMEALENYGNGVWNIHSNTD